MMRKKNTHTIIIFKLEKKEIINFVYFYRSKHNKQHQLTKKIKSIISLFSLIFSFSLSLTQTSLKSFK